MVFDIVDIANHMFESSAPIFVEEVLYRFSISYKIRKANMPSVSALIDFLGNVKDRDDGIITFIGETDQTISVGKIVDEDNYKYFLKSLVDDEEVNVLIKITKKVENETLSVYRLDLFSTFLKSLSITDHFINFTELFMIAGEHIKLNLIDKSGMLLTSTIAFSDDDVSWSEDKSRKEILMDCSSASIFLQKNAYAVVPQDFSIRHSTAECEEIVLIFNRLCSVLSYIYIANSANIISDRVVLQFDPKASGVVYALDELGSNHLICDIYSWVYKDSNCVDKVGIARGIINVYCKAREDILTIGEPIFNSIKSDYVIYQKNHAEAYIEMKNKISEFILDTGKQIQELTDDLADGLKNNFLAIIGFALTVILSDSIDVKAWAEAEVSPRVISICILFIVASLCYLGITIIYSKSKWNWIETSYGNLKNNYNGVLDDADIQEAFGNDEIKNDAYNQYKRICLVVIVLWIIIILVMGGFTWLMSKPLRQNNTQINTVKEESSEINSEGTTENSEGVIEIDNNVDE